MIRYPFEPLEQVAEDRFGNRRHPDVPDDLSALQSVDAMLASMVGYTRTAVVNWRRNGLPEAMADRLACALGYHPANLWPEWWNVAPEPVRVGPP